MYEKVIARPAPKKRSTRLWVCLALALAMLIAVLIPTIWAPLYRHRFYNFVSDLSYSTDYAYRHVSLSVTWEGEPRTASPLRFYAPYRLLGATGTGTPASPPDTPPDAFLDYGDGSTLSLWAVDVNSPNRGMARSEGLLVCYVNQSGDTFTYTQDGLTLSILESALFPPKIATRPK